MFSNEERMIYAKRQLVEVICQLRFPEILSIDASEPAAFQDRIRREYPQYEKKIEQLPPQMVNGKPVPQGTVNNYQFVSAEGQWKISLTKGFIALSTYGYTRWEEFAQRLDRILAVFIETYHPSWFTRVGLRYVNAFRRAPLGLEDCLWKELITPGFLGLMGDEDAQEQAFMKNELTATVQMPGGAKANVKSGPGLLRKVNNRTRETTEERVFMLDLDLYMDSKIELNHTAPALNIVHDNAGSPLPRRHHRHPLRTQWSRRRLERIKNAPLAAKMTAGGVCFSGMTGFCVVADCAVVQNAKRMI